MQVLVLEFGLSTLQIWKFNLKVPPPLSPPSTYLDPDFICWNCTIMPGELVMADSNNISSCFINIPRMLIKKFEDLNRQVGYIIIMPLHLV